MTPSPFGVNYATDLTPLYDMLRARGVEVEITNKVLPSDGYFLMTGENQLYIYKDGAKYSVIRGVVSFGKYEIMKIDGVGNKFIEPERFNTPEDLAGKL